jgi:hypothetical protein
MLSFFLLKEGHSNDPCWLLPKNRTVNKSLSSFGGLSNLIEPVGVSHGDFWLCYLGLRIPSLFLGYHFHFGGNQIFRVYLLLQIYYYPFNPIYLLSE